MLKFQFSKNDFLGVGYYGGTDRNRMRKFKNGRFEIIREKSAFLLKKSEHFVNRNYQ
jgi:hypothetical protein